MLGLGNGKGDVMDSSVGTNATAPTVVRREDECYVAPVSFSKADEGQPGLVKNIAVLAALVETTRCAFGLAEYIDPTVMQGQFHHPVPLCGRYEIVVDIIDRNTRRVSAGLHLQGNGACLAFISGFFSK